MAVQPMPLLPHLDDRLDASDADLVDVIHTDGNFAGTMLPTGHVDFYVGRTEASLGCSQAGCGCADNCDHARSFQLLTESVSRPVKVTKVLRCQEPQNLTLPDCKEVRPEESQLFGYFYSVKATVYSRRGLQGVIGIMIASKGPEKPCAEEENKEEDWNEDGWLNDEWLGEELETEKTTKATTTTTMKSPPEGTLHEGSPCKAPCLSIISSSVIFSIVCFMVCLFLCARRSYIKLGPSYLEIYQGSGIMYQGSN